MEDYTNMTPEERLEKIENLLAAISEHQSSFDERQAGFDKHQAGFDRRQSEFDKHHTRMAEYQARHDHEIGEIRGFEKETRIAILAVIDAQVTVAKVLKSLAESQQAGEEKLHALIETVDRMLRGPDDQLAH